MQHNLKDVMNQDVKVIGPEMTIKEAARMMCDGDFGMMPVGDNDRMIGAISDRDIAIRAVAEGKAPARRCAKSCPPAFAGFTTTTPWNMRPSS